MLKKYRYTEYTYTYLYDANYILIPRNLVAVELWKRAESRGRGGRTGGGGGGDGSGPAPEGGDIINCLI